MSWPVKARGRTRKRRGEMNKWEAEHAQILEFQKHTGYVQEYWYEDMRLRLADGAWFTVDFLVLLTDGRLECHEVKGHRERASMVRIKIAADKFPLPIRIFSKDKQGNWLEESV